MPLVRIAVPATTSSSALAHISNSVHDSMLKTFNVPAEDRFQIIGHHDVNELVAAPEYLGIKHSAKVVFIQITCNEGRTLEMKKNLFQAIATSISSGEAIKQEDVIISLVEVKKENWSFGNGIAQYAV